MILLRSIIQGLFGRNRAPVTPAPTSIAEEIIAQLVVDDGEEGDEFRLICRAIHEHGLSLPRETRAERAIMRRFLERLPDRDHEILLHFKAGKKHSEIAELMNLDVEAVRRSLVKTYADLRMLMYPVSGPNGGGEPVDVPAAQKIA